MIRKNGVIGLLVTAVVLVALNFLLLDVFAKAALVAAGEYAFRAKVDIKKVDVQVTKGKVVIESLAVGDRNNEFKNLFEVQKAVADIKLMPLLFKKIIVDKVAVEGLAIGSDRKTPGFLPQTKLKKFEKSDGKTSDALSSIYEKAKAEVKSTIPTANVKDVDSALKNSDCGKAIKKEDLASYKKINEAQEKIKAREAGIKAEIASADPSAKLKAIQEKIDAAKAVKISGPQDAPKAKEAIDSLTQAKKELDALYASANSIKEKSAQFASYAGALKDEVDQARKDDVANALNKCNINVLDASQISEAIGANIWKSRLDTALKYLSMAEKAFAVAKKDKPKVVKRLHGRDVYFPGSDLPSLWIKEIKMTSGKELTSGLAASGLITDISFEQDKTGKPLKAAVNGAKAGQTLAVKAEISRLNGINDTIEATATGVPASAAGLEKMDLGAVQMTAKNADVSLSANNNGTAVKINTSVLAKGVAWSSAQDNVAMEALKTINTLQVSAQAVAGGKDTSIKVSTDLTDRITKSLKKIYGKKLDQVKAGVEKQVASLLKGETAELDKLTNGATAGISQQAGAYKKQIDGASGSIDNVIKDLQKKSLGGALPGGLKGLFK